jgi:YidC/Oxa1 family membrane protein insertase
MKDKKSLIGMALIGVVMVGWMIYTSSTHKQIPPEQIRNVENAENVLNQITPENDNQNDATVETDYFSERQNRTEKFGTHFEEFATGEEKYLTIETDFYTAVISNKGGSLVRWRLKNYNKWDGVPVQLIGYDAHELYIQFTSIEAKKIDSRDLYFTVEEINSGKLNSSTINLSGEKTQILTFKLDLGNGKEIIKKITFQGDKYHIDQDITVNNLDGILRGGYSLIWGNSLNYQEKNSVDESEYTNALISMNGSVDDFDAKNSDFESKDYTGIIDYVAIKTKYFGVAIIPQPWQHFDGTATLGGRSFDAKNQGRVEKYQMAIQVPYKGVKHTNSFKVFIGPLEYKLVKSYGLEATIDLGWRFLIRPIAEYFILPLFLMLYSFVPNYGIVLIIFAFLMKILLYPLSIKQMRNASYMKLLAPEIEKVREKHKDNMQQQQMETMKLYSEYGLNPISGCFPLLLQMPIFMALWRTLNGVIELRQQPFILWIEDLSRPDVLFGWGFSVMGLSQISGLALLMAITLFIQQKMTVTDPRQKMIIYIMPVMFLFMFSYFPGGLNLYYFMFNLLSILQQVYINNFSKSKMTLEQLKAQPKKKEGWLAKQMRNAQEMQKATGRPLPPAMQKYIDAKSGNKNTDNNSDKKQINRRKRK